MKYMIYTDGAVNFEKGIASFAFMIRTEDKFVTQKAFVIKDKQIDEAELLGIGMAAQWLLANVNTDDRPEVVIHADSAIAIKVFSDMIEEKYGIDIDASAERNYALSFIENVSAQLGAEQQVNFGKTKDKNWLKLEFYKKMSNLDWKDYQRRPAVRMCMESIEDLAQKTELKIYKANAHSGEVNGNGVADRLARYSLRMACKR